MESFMRKTGLDNHHRNHDGEIRYKHGNTLIRTLRKVYGQGFAAGYPEAEKLSDVLLQLKRNVGAGFAAIIRLAILSTRSPTRLDSRDEPALSNGTAYRADSRQLREVYVLAKD
jgi:hypothetical protein